MTDSSGIERDRELIDRLQKRDESALNEMISLYGPRIRAVCIRICDDVLDADGVVSQVFWEAWNTSSRIDQRRGSLQTYLLILARCRSIDRKRAKSVHEGEQRKESIAREPTSKIDDPCEAQLVKEREDQIRDALDRLPAAQRNALQLAFFDGLSHREVAEKQALPLGTVKTNIRRGLLQLRSQLTGKQLTGDLA